MARHYLGIDVGTGSARAGLFDDTGGLVATDKADIQMWREAGDIVEQSSEDIWDAVCRSVRGALKKAGLIGTRRRGRYVQHQLEIAVVARLGSDFLEGVLR